jgi:phenylpropionate dioxygenase-like ring-hydroxylating dioxygenase large terminal subunit
MGSITAQLYDELGGYPGEVRPARSPGELPGRAIARGAMVAAVDASGREVAVARLASGRLVVVDDRCPHDGGRISDGFVAGEHLVCARHGLEWKVAGRGASCHLRRCKHRE